MNYLISDKSLDAKALKAARDWIPHDEILVFIKEKTSTKNCIC